MSNKHTEKDEEAVAYIMFYAFIAFIVVGSIIANAM